MSDSLGLSSNPMHQGIIIGIPACGRPVTLEWALAMTTVRMPTGTVVQYATTRGIEVGQARNQIVDQALKVGAKYIWFVDDDTAPPPYALMQLMYALDQNKEAMVCAGIYCAKCEPTMPIVYHDRGSGPYWDWKFGDVFECSSIGTGCMLVKTEIFKKIEKPWFKTMHEATDAPVSVLEFGKEKTYEQADILLTDDIYFCYKVQEAGYKILAHGGVLCTHWDVASQTPFTLAADSYPMIPRKEEPKPQKSWDAFQVCEPSQEL